METIEHELDQNEDDAPWLVNWLELKEAVRVGTWENFESKLNEEQREIVHLIGRFNAFYGIEEPNTKTLYPCFREGEHDVRYIWKNDIIRAAERKGSIAQAGRKS